MDKILVIENNKELQDTLAFELEQMRFSVNVCESLNEAVQIVSNQHYDVFIIGTSLPDGSSVDVVKKIRALKRDGVIVVISNRDSELEILYALNSGADDYMILPCSYNILVARINAHLRRYKTTFENCYNINGVSVDFSKRVVSINDSLIHLTNTEFDVLAYLIKHKNAIITRDQMLKDIWKFDYDGDSRLVDVHIFKIREKIEPLKRKIRSIRGYGYIFNEGS